MKSKIPQLVTKGRREDCNQCSDPDVALPDSRKSAIQGAQDNYSGMMVKDGRGKYPQIVLKEPIHQNVTCLYFFIFLFTLTAIGLFLQTTIEYVPVGA